MENKNTRIPQNDLPEKENEAPAFTCPNCMMADTCSDCGYFGTDESCRKWGGYTSADHWACSWYYNN